MREVIISCETFMSSPSQRTGTPPACFLFVFRTCLWASFPRPKCMYIPVSPPLSVCRGGGSECSEGGGGGGGGGQESCPVEVLVLTMRGT
jgi:hypothetical protein